MKETYRNNRMASLLERLSAECLAREGGSKPLITVTRVELSEDGKYATIFFTAYPEAMEQVALSFAKQNVGTVREFIDTHARIGHIPFLHFAIDRGEKNRQKIEALSLAGPEKSSTPKRRRGGKIG